LTSRSEQEQGREQGTPDDGLDRAGRRVEKARERVEEDVGEVVVERL
jgi:hypothetical protein